MVSIIKPVFLEVRLTEELTWTNVIILSKGRGGIQGHCDGGGDMETITSIINTGLRVGVSLHYALHGFRKGMVMGTATLEAKLS